MPYGTGPLAKGGAYRGAGAQGKHTACDVGTADRWSERCASARRVSSAQHIKAER